MTTKEYKQAALNLRQCFHAIRFVRLGLMGDKNKMYPESLTDRINIALKYWDGKEG